MYLFVYLFVCLFTNLLLRASSELDNKTPKAKTRSPLLQEEIHGSALHRSVSLSETLDRRPKVLESGPLSLALLLRWPQGEMSPSQVVRTRDAPTEVLSNTATSSSPSAGQTLQIALFVMTR